MRRIWIQFLVVLGIAVVLGILSWLVLPACGIPQNKIIAAVVAGVQFGSLLCSGLLVLVVGFQLLGHFIASRWRLNVTNKAIPFGMTAEGVVIAMISHMLIMNDWWILGGACMFIALAMIAGAFFILGMIVHSTFKPKP